MARMSIEQSFPIPTAYVTGLRIRIRKIFTGSGSYRGYVKLYNSDLPDPNLDPANKGLDPQPCYVTFCFRASGPAGPRIIHKMRPELLSKFSSIGRDPLPTLLRENVYLGRYRTYCTAP